MDPSGLSKMLKERKRHREERRYNRQLRVLSNMIPGSDNEYDKALLVENAIKYIEHLQERVGSLEGRTNSSAIGKEDEQSVASSEDRTSDDGDDSDSSLPRIHVYVSQRELIISILCKRRKNLLSYTLSEVEKQHLSVIGSGMMSFGCAEVSINIHAEIDDGALINAKDFRNHMLLVVSKLMDD